MATKEPATDALIDEAERALKEMLKEVTSKVKVRADGTVPEVFSLTDKMKVIDRVIKLAAIKAKLKDDEYGSGFMQPEPDEKD
jgi:hypothetical protein